MSVACIRIGSVRLCLALMLALLVVPGYVVAPVLFAKAGSSALAGELAGAVFHMANLGLIFLALAVIVFWLRMGREPSALVGRLRWTLLLAILLLVAGNEYAIAPMIADLKVQMGPIDQVAAENPLRQQFGMWHGVSAVLHLLASLAATGLVALGAVRPGLKNPDRDKCPS